MNKGAELIIFPEMSFTGFSMNVSIISKYDKKICDRIREYGYKYQINIGFGWVRLQGDKGENHYSISPTFPTASCLSTGGILSVPSMGALQKTCLITAGL